MGYAGELILQFFSRRHHCAVETLRDARTSIRDSNYLAHHFIFAVSRHQPHAVVALRRRRAVVQDGHHSRVAQDLLADGRPGITTEIVFALDEMSHARIAGEGEPQGSSIKVDSNVRLPVAHLHRSNIAGVALAIGYTGEIDPTQTSSLICGRAALAAVQGRAAGQERMRTCRSAIVLKGA